MNKALFWIAWGLAFLVVNLAALPIAVFILYGAEEAASLFSGSFLKVTGLFLLSNLITLQMLIAGRKEHKRGFLIGLNIALLQVIGIVTFISTLSTAAVILTMAILVAAVILLVREVRWRAY